MTRPTSLSHIEYIGGDTAPLFGLTDWPGGQELAFVCVTELGGQRRTYLTEDVAWARMLEEAAGGVTLTAAIAADKLPIHRDGWPSDWLNA